MIGLIVKAVLSPLIGLGETYIKEKGKERQIEAGVSKVVYETQAGIMKIKLGFLLGRIPLFVLEITHVAYFSAIALDSFAWSNGWFAPLELPAWYKPYAWAVLMSVVGISTVERAWKLK